ncbi:MAG TPA: LacI family DNA-binding transcriptional regulator, partial [Bacillaceae bacterium]|nr:LacI family DNA-binding transcriptional regulator [Bacillaceae bacterium]
MVSIRDVANLAGVSIATVSRVMNKREYVSKNTEKKIIRAIEELNYVPNPLARGLVGKKMSSIAMIVPDIMNPFYP